MTAIILEDTLLDVAERPHLPRKRTWSFYFALLAVLPIWSCVPLSWVFVIYALGSGRIWSFHLLGRTCFFIAICEVFFSVYYYYLAATISGPSPLKHPDIKLQQAAFKRVIRAGLAKLPEDGFDEESLEVDRPCSPEENIEQLETTDPRAIDFRNSLRNWFGKVPFSAISVHHMHTWLYGFIFNEALPPPDAIPLYRRTVIDEALKLLEFRSGCIIPTGVNHSVTPICLTLDKINVCLRPLSWYIAVSLGNWLIRMFLARKCGTKFGSYEGLEYLIRIPEGWTPNHGCPIVLLHGLGLGLLQYSVSFTHFMQAMNDHPFLIPIQPHVSQDMFHSRYLKPMPSWETANALAGLLVNLGWVEEHFDWDGGRDAEELEVKKQLTPKREGQGSGIIMLSHSNGSYAHAWMLKHHPSMVKRSCFVDPVTFCSWEGDVCYNFLYRPCTTGIELLMRYFVGTELGIANLLQRNFDWAANALWYEEIPNARDPYKTKFMVGGQDDIVNAERVRRYLSSHGIRKGLYYDSAGRHGQALIFGGPGHTEIVRWLKEPESNT